MGPYERFYAATAVCNTSDALNWRFGKMTRRAGIGHWHAHEDRHTAVSIMSSNGVPLQEISDTVGHKSTHVTETVYRHVIVPAIRGGATVMDDVFGDADHADYCAPTATRTRDLLLRRQCRSVARRRLAWPDVPLRGSDNGWMWPGVARYLRSLAPRLAPRNLVSNANVQWFRTIGRHAASRVRPPASPAQRDRSCGWRGLQQCGKIAAGGR